MNTLLSVEVSLEMNQSQWFAKSLAILKEILHLFGGLLLIPNAKANLMNI